MQTTVATVFDALMPFWFSFTIWFCVKDGFTGYKKWLAIILIGIFIISIFRKYEKATTSFEKVFQFLYPALVSLCMAYLFVNWK